ncbi:MAG: helix-turn-helix domain-containing protein [Clostridia bacterium]|nr:helix-turn-helix domain-containing protein [Clostridia bacterium]
MDFKALRKSRGWSQMKAATELGISFITWQRWELGGCKPSEENIKKLKEVFANELKQ